ncbi:MAG: 50S ribosomal protein L15 [Candidatus Latescibacterota bacterium]
MNLGALQPAPGARKNRKRVGRGTGSGHDGTSCRGHKGQNSRSGAKHRAFFEGGQTPLQRRLPKRGFNNARFKVSYQVVNVGAIFEKEWDGEVSPDSLRTVGLIGATTVPVKILGAGELTRALTVKAHAFSSSAIAKIEGAGGKVEVIGRA